MATESEAARLMAWHAATSEGRRAAVSAHRVAGQAIFVRGRGPIDVEGHPDSRRIRLSERLAGRAVLSRREALRNRRRDFRGAADGDCARVVPVKRIDHRQLRRVLGRRSHRAAPAGRRWSHRLPGDGLPRRSDDGDSAEAAGAQSRGGLSGGFPCASSRCAAVVRAARHPHHHQRRRRESARLPRRRRGARGRSRHRRSRQGRRSSSATICIGNLDALLASGEPLVNMDTGQALSEIRRARAVGECVHRRRGNREGARARRERRSSPAASPTRR